MTFSHAGHEWSYQPECGVVEDAPRWSISTSQSYNYDIHLATTPALHANTYFPYLGRPLSKPPSIDTSHPQNDLLSRSASSIPLPRDRSATCTDFGKFASREERLGLASATSSQPSLAPVLDVPTSRGYFDHFLAPTYIRYYSADEEEDPNDPYDVQTDDEAPGQSALINYRTTPNLILDERMAYLLRHFCNILRPCISIFERPLTHDGSSTFAEKLPRLALSSRGLLHGMMAVSALHLALLHHTSEVIPLKHFVVASRILNRLLTSPSTRHKLETLSLCLFLAFYSVMLGDHAKWMMHLKGCSAFLMEHDFAATARSILTLGPATETNYRTSLNKHATNADNPLPDQRPDEIFIGKLTGLHVDYANQVQPMTGKGESQQDAADNDIDDCKTKMDLLFWYLKMDIFQSTLSGDRLLLPYDKWKYFPPRGEIGSVKKLYATMDHLWLVLGRLADFGAKDRVRKQSKIATSGGHWKPDPEHFVQPQRSSELERNSNPVSQTSNAQIPHHPTANESRTRAPKAASNPSRSKRGPPLFYGMMPPPPIPPSMLSEFHIMDTELRRGSTPEMPKGSEPEEADVEAQTNDAVMEHNAIAEALQAWKEALNPEFDALQSPPTGANGPFTPTLRYSDPTVASMWALYHFGRILLRRYHPASPPAMMMSAVVNAPFTHEDAQIIGRINAGLLESQAELAGAGSMNPTLVAALQELTFPLMFAGVQFQDPVQRSWTIDNLLDVARDSGWKSAFSVASAMETAWSAQGNYERTLRRRNPHDARRYDVDVSASGDLGMTQEEQHESRFNSHDRRLIDRFSDLRAYWAIGVISTSEDIEKLLGQMKLGHDP